MTEFSKWLLGEWTVHEFLIERGPVGLDGVRKLDALKRDLKASLAADMNRLQYDAAGRLYRQTFFRRAPEVLGGR